MKKTAVILYLLSALPAFASYELRYGEAAKIYEEGVAAGVYAPVPEAGKDAISPAEFKRRKPEEPAEFRCDVSPAFGHYGSFAGQEDKYFPVFLYLHAPGGGFERFLGYVDKESPAGKAVRALPEDGNDHKGYVSAKYRPGEENDDCVEITAFRPDSKK